MGRCFFGSSNDLVERFRYGEDPKRVLIDLTHSRSGRLERRGAGFHRNQIPRHGATVTFVGLDQRSSSFHERLTGQLGA